MIIFDYNQVAISNLMEQIGTSKDAIQENEVRTMILNTLRKYVKKFKHTYGPEVVIACDSRTCWRKDVFEYYKANRKKVREDSGFDWPLIYSCINKIKEELATSSPYKVVEVDKAEADDIISVLARKYSPTQKVLILSSDKDFPQLQKFPNVEQYHPVMEKFIKEPFPDLQLKQLIIRGDRGDGVPNILSADDVFVTGTRQKSIFEAKLIVWLNQKPEEFCNDYMLRNYARNTMLIDLTKIPSDIEEKILLAYDGAKGKTKNEFMNYMIEHRLKNLIELLGEF